MDLKKVVELMTDKENPKSIYDIVAQNYWDMDKGTLATIIKEFNYATHRTIFKSEYKEIEEMFIDNLNEIIEYNED